MINSNSYLGQTTRYRDETSELSIIKVLGTNNQIAIRNSSYTTVDDFTSSLVENPIIVDYVISSSNRKDIELPKIETLQGINNISVCSSNGVCASNIEVEYDE